MLAFQGTGISKRGFELHHHTVQEQAAQGQQDHHQVQQEQYRAHQEWRDHDLFRRWRGLTKRVIFMRRNGN